MIAQRYVLHIIVDYIIVKRFSDAQQFHFQ